jgi:hypothetical protein
VPRGLGAIESLFVGAPSRASGCCTQGALAAVTWKRPLAGRLGQCVRVEQFYTVPPVLGPAGGDDEDASTPATRGP